MNTHVTRQVAEAAVREGDVVRLTDVRRRFGTTAALDGVSLTVHRGEILGIIGRSGAGKSTLIRCLNGLERLDSGSIAIEGREITGLGEADLQPLRRRIGMIFQHFNLLSAKTVEENIALPLKIEGWPKTKRLARAAELIEIVGLSGKAKAYPSELSGGQKQRVGIARALAASPALLLSDEATSALDPETTRAILALLKDINRKLGLTILLITHEMEVVRSIADRVTVLDAGRIVEEGPVWQIFAAPQTETTKSLLSGIRPQLPAHVARKLAADVAGEAILGIDIAGPAATGPLFKQLSAEFPEGYRLIHGGVDHIQEQPVGRFFIAIPAEAAARFTSLAERFGAKVEVLGHVADHA
jgi:D-methionine transport system ATP-binding protein